MIEAILNIPVLFFLFGVVAIFLGSNIEIPRGMTTAITMYLMLAIGIKGGISLGSENLSWTVFEPTLIVVFGSIIVASYIFFFAKKFLTRENAAAIAATYGSNSTMTFVTGAAFFIFPQCFLWRIYDSRSSADGDTSNHLRDISCHKRKPCWYLGVNKECFD